MFAHQEVFLTNMAYVKNVQFKTALNAIALHPPHVIDVIYLLLPHMMLQDVLALTVNQSSLEVAALHVLWITAKNVKMQFYQAVLNADQALS